MLHFFWQKAKSFSVFWQYMRGVSLFLTIGGNYFTFWQNAKSVSICLTRCEKGFYFFDKKQKATQFLLQRFFENLQRTIRYLKLVYNFYSVFSKMCAKLFKFLKMCAHLERYFRLYFHCFSLIYPEPLLYSQN